MYVQSVIHILVFFFFFQAEDGIRDFHVTGVQTCALPIWATDRIRSASGSQRTVPTGSCPWPCCAPPRPSSLHNRGSTVPPRSAKIGRASCREGGGLYVGAVKELK